MTENPNIKAEILQFAIETTDECGEAVNLYDFAEQSEYGLERIAHKSEEMYPLLECGVSPRVPWIQRGRRGEVIEQLEEWGYEVDE